MLILFNRLGIAGLFALLVLAGCGSEQDNETCNSGDCAECESKSEEECLTAPLCIQEHGVKLNSDGACGDGGFVECVPRDRECGDAISQATAPNGSCWQFNSTCLPSTFRAAEQGCDLQAFEDCN